MKTLVDIKEDMSALYDELKDGKVELKTAAELANIAGKYLKAEQLELATAIFLSDKPQTPALPNPQRRAATRSRQPGAAAQ